MCESIRRCISISRARRSGTGKTNSSLRRKPSSRPAQRKPGKQSSRLPEVTAELLLMRLGFGKAALTLPEQAVDLVYKTRLGLWSLRVGLTIKAAKPRFHGRGTIYDGSSLPSGRRLYLLVTKSGRRWGVGQVFSPPRMDITTITFSRSRSSSRHGESGSRSP